MKPLLEIAPFLAVAVAAHVGAFALVAQGGVSAGGDGGQGQITLEGGDAALAALVAAWERPPELAPSPALAGPALTDLATTADSLPQPRPSVTPELPGLQAMEQPAPASDTTPDTTAPAPPPAPRVALITDPAALPERPALPDTTEAFAPLPPAAPALAALPERAELVNASPDTLPDTSPPPPLPPLAEAPERSPHPPARPQPRRDTATAPAAPAQRATGTGARGHEGQARAARETSRAQADTGGLVAQWGGAIRAAVQRQQRHPAGTRSGGTVLLRLSVHSDGQLLSVALHQSSGHAALDQAALDAVRRARIPTAPQGLNGSFQFNLPVRFQG